MVSPPSSSTTGTGPHTRSGLTPARLETADGELGEKIVVHFMFNPTQYTLTKENSWEAQTQTNADQPAFSFTESGPIKLSLDLWFDTLLHPASTQEPYDVRAHTDLLWKMMDLKPPKSGETQSSPPLIDFIWGGLNIRCILTKVTQNFTLFRADGHPVRAKVTVELTQSNAKKSIQQTGLSIPTTQPVDISSRADLIAALALGMAISAIAPTVNKGASEVAKATREVMADNGIDDPLSLQTGVDLVVESASS